MEGNTNTTPSNQIPGRGLAIAGMILGILSLIVSFIPCVGWFAVLPAIVGIILSIVALNQGKRVNAPKGMALTGLICSIIAIIMAIIMTMFVAAAGMKVAEEMKNSGAMDSLNSALRQLEQVTDTLNNNH